MHCLAMLPETLPHFLGILFLHLLNGDLEVHIQRECLFTWGFLYSGLSSLHCVRIGADGIRTPSQRGSDRGCD